MQDLKARLDGEEAEARARQDRARKADTLLKNPLLNEAIEAVRTKLYHEFCNAKYADDETRLRASVGADMLDRVVKAVFEHVREGKVAEKALSQIEMERRLFGRRRA